MNDGSYVNIQIVDTGGKEQHSSLNKSYYTNADCALLVFDVTNRDSFDKIKDYYLGQIQDNCKEDIEVILLGNKVDLKNDRQISKNEAMNFADKKGFIYKETSCEQNFNVADAFESLIILVHLNNIKKIEGETPCGLTKGRTQSECNFDKKRKSFFIKNKQLLNRKKKDSFC